MFFVFCLCFGLFFVYVWFVFFVGDLRMALFLCFFVLFYACLHKKAQKKHKNKALRK